MKTAPISILGALALSSSFAVETKICLIEPEVDTRPEEIKDLFRMQVISDAGEMDVHIDSYNRVEFPWNDPKPPVLSWAKRGEHDFVMSPLELTSPIDGGRYRFKVVKPDDLFVTLKKRSFTELSKTRGDLEAVDVVVQKVLLFVRDKDLSSSNAEWRKNTALQYLRDLCEHGKLRARFLQNTVEDQLLHQATGYLNNWYLTWFTEASECAEQADKIKWLAFAMTSYLDLTRSNFASRSSTTKDGWKEGKMLGAVDVFKNAACQQRVHNSIDTFLSFWRNNVGNAEFASLKLAGDDLGQLSLAGFEQDVAGIWNSSRHVTDATKGRGRR